MKTLGCLFACVLALPTAGQSDVHLQASLPGMNVVALESEQLAVLMDGGGSVTIRGVPLPGGIDADLELRSFRVVSPGAQAWIGRRDGRDEPFDFDFESVVFYRGQVAGVPGSHVFLSLSDRMSTGRIEIDGAVYGLSDRGPAGQAMGPGRLSIFKDAGTSPLGSGLPGCGLETSGHRVTVPAAIDGSPIKGLKQIEIAVETDYEYFVLFNDLNDAATYLLQTYAIISDIYIRDVNTHVTVSWFRLWDDPNDLFNEQEPLGPFRDYWNQNMQSVPRDVAQFFTGRRNLTAGGVAYLNGLCNNNSYSWAGYILGYHADPAHPHVFNRDFMVAAHELGHNCGTPHTHDLGLDTCHDPETQPRRGTIMAYCGQTFTGGEANMDPRFHAVVQLVMEEYIFSRGCVADDCNQNGVPDANDIAAGTSPDANGNGVPDECEDCNGNGVLDPQDITSGFSKDLNGNGLPDECEPDCNGNGIPDDLDFLPTGGASVFHDDFETDKGWVTENLGATSGNWERGVPVNDPNWQYDPVSDSDGSGNCLLTQNAPGNTDVDNGATRITSPVLDLSAGNLSVLYDYYLYLTNENGADRIVVEMSDDNGGSWATVAVHDTNGELDWRSHAVTPAAIAAAGLNQTATMRVRFTINDDNPQSIVEGGIDAFRVAVYVPPVSEDLNANNVPDECEADCNGNGVIDWAEIIADMALDVNRNSVLDSCEDCDGDMVPDIVELGMAHNVWVAHLEDFLRQYDALTGVETRASAAGHVVDPNDVLIDQASGRVFVTSADDRVVEFAADGTYVGDFAGPASGLVHPTGMLFLPDGTLLVASRDTASVFRFDIGSGMNLGQFVAPGSGGLVGPFGMTLDGAGHLLVTSSDNRVLRYDAGTGAFVDVLVPAGSGGLDEPRGMAINPVTGGLLVASYGTDQVLEFDAGTGAFVRQFNKGGTIDPPRMTMDNPWCIRIGRDGDVYVSRHDANESAPTGALHLTNASIYHFDASLGYFERAYVLGLNAGLHHPTGFDFLPGGATDCNFNQVPDNCDILSGFSEDRNGNGVPDECESLCYPDCDGSGGLDLFDFLCFVNEFNSGNPYADCDGSGGLDLFDFLCFVNEFNSGCP